MASSSSSYKMRKAFYYPNLMPTKAEEESAAVSGCPHRLTRTVVDIRDTRNNSKSSGIISKTLTSEEVSQGKFVITPQDMLELYRFWNNDKCNKVEEWNRIHVTIVDLTYDRKGKIIKYKSEDERTFLEKGHDGSFYLISAIVFFEELKLRVGDKIQLKWLKGRCVEALGFKLLTRGGN